MRLRVKRSSRHDRMLCNIPVNLIWSVSEFRILFAVALNVKRPLFHDAIHLNTPVCFGVLRLGWFTVKDLFGMVQRVKRSWLHNGICCDTPVLSVT